MAVHDWGEEQAVAFVAGSGATHLVEAELLRWVMSWPADGAIIDEEGLSPADADSMRAQVRALLHAGIVQEAPPTRLDT